MNLIGKQFQVTSFKEDYTIIEEHEQGYLTVQKSTFKRAGMDAGKEVIHISEIDGKDYKWHSPTEIDSIIAARENHTA